MRGDWGTGEGETNYPYPGSGFHRESKAFQHPAARPWRARGARETLLAASPSSGHWCLCPFFKGCSLIPKPQSGVETLWSQKEGPGSPSLPCFPLGIGPCLLPPQGTQKYPSMFVQVGAAGGSSPGNTSPTDAQHVPRWLFEQSLLPFFLCHSNYFIPSATENQCVFSVRSPGLKLSVP